ncbi:serine/threonine protein kinase [Pendulispora rubella]|uniref:Serine/threonine protein kinase n=1 Tax=Pendulispora rubella TaxID=2741070 RepID=A0ABZ2LB17_9BACT
MPENPVRLLGRYALHGEIAVGGMATVHFGRLHGAIGFSRTVAIKRLHKQYARDPDFVSMFLDEARLAARIRHPNVVPTLDVVATEGELFVVMEYVHGESLSRLIRQETQKGQAIPPAIVGSILSGTLQGLHAAHEARDERGQPLSIVHRDVSPQNILVGSDGVARVLDFGVAKAAGRIHTTQQGQIKGKLPYMAPEQLSSESELTRQVDVYAAAVCLWEALTGRRLFSGDNEGIVLARVLTSEVEPPSRYARDVSPELDDVVLRGLARDLGQRFATAREMAIALERALGRVASAAEIADWMEGAAGVVLAARHRAVAAMEQQTPITGPVSTEQVLHEISSMRKAPETRPTAEMGVPSAPAPVEMPSEPETAPSAISAYSQAFSEFSPGAERRRRAIVVAALVGFAGLLVVLFGVAIWASRKDETREELRVGPTVTAEPTTTTVASAPPSPSATPSTPTTSTSTSEVPKAVGKPMGKPKKNCDPPYSIDANGRKRFKAECL